MKLRYKILNGILLLLVIAIGSGMIVLSRDKPCAPAPALSADAETMKAIVSRCYGGPEALELEDVEKPAPGDDEVLVKVHAAGVNPLDYHYMRGKPYIMRLSTGVGVPTDARMGVDYAGTVVAVGSNVTKFKPGDEVFGGRSGAFGQYVLVPDSRAIVHKPGNVTFAQAAGVGVAAVTALEALRDKGQIKSGDKVLINGASGGVGTFAVQIAKSYGAEVHGVCSTRNVEMVTSLGADHVFDYKKESYIDSGEQYDLIIDNVGNHSLSANLKVLKPGGRMVLVGGPKTGQWIGPLLRPAKAMMMNPFVDQELIMLLASLGQDDLEFLADLMQQGKVTPIIDKHYPLSEVPEAIRYSESGRARGKIIIDVK